MEAIEEIGSQCTSRDPVAESTGKMGQYSLNELLEFIEDGYFEVDLKGNLTFFNESLQNILGYSADELMLMNQRQYMDEANGDKSWKTLHEIYITGEPVKDAEWKVVRKDGNERHLEVSVSQMKSTEGTPVGYRGLARDVTERKIMESQILESQKLESIGQLAAGIAHEINTPMQYISDNIYFIENSFDDIESLLDKFEKLFKAVKMGKIKSGLLLELESSIEELEMAYLREEIPVAIKQTLEGVARVSKIVKAMKEFSHPGTDEMTLIDINRAIQSTITVARNEWKYSCQVDTDLDISLPCVPCLPAEFNQAILNIIINAVHAIDDVVGRNSSVKGRIKVITCNYKEWAEIRISDTGPGIPKDIQSKIFNPFFTTKEVGRGTGQGLHIVHAIIVNKHGGTIRFESEIGKGTTFIIRLPIKNEMNIERSSIGKTNPLHR
jgi:PAS domain S-box-containing protein